MNTQQIQKNVGANDIEMWYLWHKFEIDIIVEATSCIFMHVYIFVAAGVHSFKAANHETCKYT